MVLLPGGGHSRDRVLGTDRLSTVPAEKDDNITQTPDEEKLFPGLIPPCEYGAGSWHTQESWKGASIAGHGHPVCRGPASAPARGPRSSPGIRLPIDARAAWPTCCNGVMQRYCSPRATRGFLGAPSDRWHIRTTCSVGIGLGLARHYDFISGGGPACPCPISIDPEMGGISIGPGMGLWEGLATALSSTEIPAPTSQLQLSALGQSEGRNRHLGKLTLDGTRAAHRARYVWALSIPRQVEMVKFLLRIGRNPSAPLRHGRLSENRASWTLSPPSAGSSGSAARSGKAPSGGLRLRVTGSEGGPNSNLPTEPMGPGRGFRSSVLL